MSSTSLWFIPKQEEEEDQSHKFQPDDDSSSGWRNSFRSNPDDENRKKNGNLHEHPHEDFQYLKKKKPSLAMHGASWSPYLENLENSDKKMFSSRPSSSCLSPQQNSYENYYFNYLIELENSDNNNSSNNTNSTQPFMINVSDSFAGIGFSYYLYYLFAFLIWLVFFDHVIPGNSLWNVTFSTLAFTLVTIISLITIHRAKIASSRWSYLLLAACEVLCGFLAYTVYVIRFLMTKNGIDRQKILQNLRSEFKNDDSRLEFIQNEVARRKWTQSHTLQLHPPAGTFVFYNRIYLQDEYLPRFRKTLFQNTLRSNNHGQQLVSGNNLEASLLETDPIISNTENDIAVHSSFQSLQSLEDFSHNHQSPPTPPQQQQEYVPPQITTGTDTDNITTTSVNAQSFYYTNREDGTMTSVDLNSSPNNLIYYEIEIAKGWADAFIRSFCFQIYLFGMQAKYRTPYAFSSIVDVNRGFSLMKFLNNKISSLRQRSRRSRDAINDSTLENSDYVTFDTLLKEHGTKQSHFKSKLSVVSSSATNDPSFSADETNFQFIEEEVTPKEITLLESREHLIQQANKSSYSIMNDLEEGCCKVTSSVRPPVQFGMFAPTEKQAAISIGFQVSRVIIPFILEMASEILLPTDQIEPIRYFHNFISQMFFGLFYNYLFVKVETWENFFLLTFINFIFLLVQYPLRATRTSYFVTQKVKYWILYIFGVKKFYPSLFYRITLQTYEHYLRNICAKFYLYEISSFASTLSFLIFTKILKSSEYNFQMYPILRDRYVNDSQYELSITSQSLVLLALEFLFIVIINVLVFIGTKKHISIVGRKLTVEDAKTRFLFAIFMLHFLNDIHYFMQRAPKFD
ncbi:hypothetical protein FDP41_004323 [Naegleria fowleri]|uniref:Uncharacterized protein n=1 Tax=Naegleria fowleri TaxID=5763 RepID=A0A6A5BQK0_NAEFO|nr:uncharacterized protein FDP41_004323 [Naegleria fowleri]KAF0976424.1 hypothetical protein FDP41_004323 [Naegleria fowleri]